MKPKLRIGIIGLISLIYGQAFTATAAPNKFPEIYPGVEYGTKNDITKYDLILHFYPNSLYKLTYHFIMIQDSQTSQKSFYYPREAIRNRIQH